MRDISYKYYEDLFDSLEDFFKNGYSNEIGEALDDICGSMASDRYRKVSKRTGVPWFVVGLIHKMECDCDFKKGLHNGESWKKETTLVPKGKGPFPSWETAAVDALEMKRNIMPPIWTHGTIGKFLEQFNGLGYALKNVNSPYLWAASPPGKGVGKFGSDGKYDSNLISEQIGAMTLLSASDGFGDEDIVFEKMPLVFFDPNRFRKESRTLQHFLNGLLESEGRKSERLKADGYAGNKTNTIYKEFFGHNLFGAIE